MDDIVTIEYELNLDNVYLTYLVELDGNVITFTKDDILIEFSTILNASLRKYVEVFASHITTNDEFVKIIFTVHEECKVLFLQKISALDINTLVGYGYISNHPLSEYCSKLIPYNNYETIVNGLLVVDLSKTDPLSLSSRREIIQDTCESLDINHFYSPNIEFGSKELLDSFDIELVHSGHNNIYKHKGLVIDVINCLSYIERNKLPMILITGKWQYLITRDQIENIIEHVMPGRRYYILYDLSISIELSNKNESDILIRSLQNDEHNITIEDKSNMRICAS